MEEDFIGSQGPQLTVAPEKEKKKKFIYVINIVQKISNDYSI
jgi:hypothetical protein